MSNYKKLYDEKIVRDLKDEFKYSSVMQVPKLEKIVINMGCGDGARDRSRNCRLRSARARGRVRGRSCTRRARGHGHARGGDVRP